MAEHDQRSGHFPLAQNKLAFSAHFSHNGAAKMGISTPTARTESRRCAQDEATHYAHVVNPCVRAEVEADLLAMCRQAPQSWSGMTLESLCSALIKQERAMDIIFERLVSPDGVVQEKFSRDRALDPCAVRVEVSRRRKKPGAWVDAGLHALGGFFGAFGKTGGGKDDVAPVEKVSAEKIGTVAQQEAQKVADALRKQEASKVVKALQKEEAKGVTLPVAGVTRPPEKDVDEMPNVEKEKVDDVVEQDDVQGGGLFEDLFGGLADVFGFGTDDDKKMSKVAKKERKKVAEKDRRKREAKKKKKQSNKTEEDGNAQEVVNIDRFEADQQASLELMPEELTFKSSKDGKPMHGKDGTLKLFGKDGKPMMMDPSKKGKDGKLMMMDVSKKGKDGKPIMMDPSKKGKDGKPIVITMDPSKKGKDGKPMMMDSSKKGKDGKPMMIGSGKKGKDGKVMDTRNKEAGSKGKADKELAISPGKGPFESPGKKGPPPSGPAPIPKTIPQVEWEDGQPTHIPPPPGKNGDSAPGELAYGAPNDYLATKKAKGLPPNMPQIDAQKGKKKALGQGALKEGPSANKGKSKQEMMNGKKTGMLTPPGKKGE